MNKWLTAASATTLALTFSTSVFAHSHLGGSTPVDGETVAKPLEEIVLNFDGKIEQGSYFDVQNTTGANIIVEQFIIGDGTLTGTLAEALPNDDYTVNWHIISADGHPLEGTFSFTMNAPISEPVIEETPIAEEQPVAAPAEKQAPFSVGAIVGTLIIIVAAGILITRRKN